MKTKNRVEIFSARSLYWKNCNIKVNLHKETFFYLSEITVHLGHPKFGEQTKGVIFLHIRRFDEMKEEIKKRATSLIAKKVFEKWLCELNSLIRFDFSFKRSNKQIDCNVGIQEIKILLKTFGIEVKKIDSRCFEIEETSYVINGDNIISLKSYLESKYVLHE